MNFTDLGEITGMVICQSLRFSSTFRLKSMNEDSYYYPYKEQHLELILDEFQYHHQKYHLLFHYSMGTILVLCVYSLGNSYFYNNSIIIF